MSDLKKCDNCGELVAPYSALVVLVRRGGLCQLRHDACSWDCAAALVSAKAAKEAADRAEWINECERAAS